MTPPEPLRLQYRSPYDWPRMLRFLGARSVKGVEAVHCDSYLRTARIGEHTGWLRVRNEPAENTLLVELSPSLASVRSTLTKRLEHLFDIAADPEIIAAHLSQHALLAATLAQRPGLRVAGAFDAFELVVRAILGQQVTVKAATTIAGRFASAFGEAIDTPDAALTHLSPTAHCVAAATIDEIASLGIIQTRARSIIAVAIEMESGRLVLEAGAHPDAVIAQLVALPGIGPWTAHYVAMRALRWSDAFPKEDIAVRNALGRVTAKRAEELSQPWRPWRSYALLHLWSEMGERASDSR
jgi:AraC family transcriptional regulator, regulatory protein of adaptative response / DNA-3-methyladenine glycosylase II